MALTDWRRLLEADAHNPSGGALALEVVDAGADMPQAFRHRLRLETLGTVALDYYALGELIDQLREAAGLLLALQGDPTATAALVALDRARATPSWDGSE